MQRARRRVRAREGFLERDQDDDIIDEVGDQVRHQMKQKKIHKIIDDIYTAMPPWPPGP